MRVKHRSAPLNAHAKVVYIYKYMYTIIILKSGIVKATIYTLVVFQTAEIFIRLS